MYTFDDGSRRDRLGRVGKPVASGRTSGIDKRGSHLLSADGTATAWPVPTWSYGPPYLPPGITIPGGADQCRCGATCRGAKFGRRSGSPLVGVMLGARHRPRPDWSRGRASDGGVGRQNPSHAQMARS